MDRTAAVSVLLFALVFWTSSAREDLEALFISGNDAVLRCLAEAEPGVSYRYVIWYKVSESPSQPLSGLIIKGLTKNNSTIQRYNGLMRDVELLEDSQSLLLPNVTQQDAGRYLCFLAAPLGHQNQEREIHLRVYELTKDENMRTETGKRTNERENDTLFVVLAIILLTVALLMFYCSYICLRNTLISHKEKSLKPARLKGTQQMKHLIVSLKSNKVVSNLLPEEYV